MKIHKIRFIVEGSTSFPIDMLRYDCCYPETAEDSAAILNAEPGCEPVRVKVIKNTTGPSAKSGNYTAEPTEGCWASFGWHVVAVEAV